MELGVTMHALSFLVYVVNVLSKKTCGNFYKIVQCQKKKTRFILSSSILEPSSFLEERGSLPLPMVVELRQWLQVCAFQ